MLVAVAVVGALVVQVAAVLVVAQVQKVHLTQVVVAVVVVFPTVLVLLAGLALLLFVMQVRNEGLAVHILLLEDFHTTHLQLLETIQHESFC
jgi:hypothetical protein